MCSFKKYLINLFLVFFLSPHPPPPPPKCKAITDQISRHDVFTLPYEIHCIPVLFYSCFNVFRTRGRKEGNVLFNDALNTFYLRLYGVGHMLKYHTNRERGNPLLLLHGLPFPISSKGSFICIHIQDKIYHGLCYISR